MRGALSGCRALSSPCLPPARLAVVLSQGPLLRALAPREARPVQSCLGALDPGDASRHLATAEDIKSLGGVERAGNGTGRSSCRRGGGSRSAAPPHVPMAVVAGRGSLASILVSACRDPDWAGDLKRRFRTTALCVFQPRGRGFSTLRIRSDFSLTPPAHSLQPSPPLPPSPFAPRRSPHPSAKRFVQEAFRIGVAMRKALSI